MSALKFQFDATQRYQIDAISSVVDIFRGQLKRGVQFSVVKGQEAEGALPGIGQAEGGVGNVLTITDGEMLENVRAIQNRNGISDTNLQEPLKAWEIEDPIFETTRLCPHFTTEMETGTGKTYVYLRTIMELAKNYGYRKFVIVVPSIAIREGTLKSLEQTREHLAAIYNHEPMESFVYDSKNASRVRQFSSSTNIQVMVINIQAFVKGYSETQDVTSGNIIYKESDMLSGRRPIDFVQAARPIVIIDEPQSVDNTAKSQEAIKQLNPLCTLRYSATHRDRYNLMYVLNPIKAFELRLVKQIMVSEVSGADEGNEALVRLISVDNKKGLVAKVAINQRTQDGAHEKIITVAVGDDLYKRSKELPVYKEGFQIVEINADPNGSFIKLSSSKVVGAGEQLGGVREDVWEAQIDKTVEHHFEKVLRVSDRSMKVLSLFFVDKVANYRAAPGKLDERGKFADAFEMAFKKYCKDRRFKHLPLANIPVELVHDGYFSQDKKGYKDTKGDTQVDEDTYNLIMRDKERLLSLDVPLQFIFSHSALREGWDSPNVFQICTLNETESVMKKRQEIGRGLRIPLDSTGTRVFDDSLNKLTVIANESYEEFARKLQTEYEEDCDIIFGRVTLEALVEVLRNGDGGDPRLRLDDAQKIAREVREALRKAKIIDADDNVTPGFNPQVMNIEIDLPPGVEGLRSAFVDLCMSVQIGNHVKRVRNERPNLLKMESLESPAFKSLWEKIRPRTTYAVRFDSDDFVDKSIVALRRKMTEEPLKAPKIIKRTADVKVDKKGVIGQLIAASEEVLDMSNHPVQDIVAYLQSETELTRKTVVRVLKESATLDKFFVNPQVYLDRVAEVMQAELGKLLLRGIKYERLVSDGHEQVWGMDLFHDEDMIDVEKSVVVKKSIYEYVVYDSDIERKFAVALDLREDIELFVKLPAWFKIDTPVGRYNPDWAIVKKSGDIVYMVRETKATTNLDLLRFPSEKSKILYGTKHFVEIGTDFEVVVHASDV